MDESRARRDEAEDPRLPWQPLGASVQMMSGMMRKAPLVGPGIAAAQDELGRVEDALWREARRRIDSDRDDDVDTPQHMLAALLARSVEQTAAEARHSVLVRLLSEIEPDEARILAALSDGTSYPVVHVVTRQARGGARLLENISTVGRAAGVALPDYVPIYVARLRRLGLVVTGPSDDAHNDGYEMLGTERLVREAQASWDGGTRLVRRTLRLSTLGHDLWDICVE